MLARVTISRDRTTERRGASWPGEAAMLVGAVLDRPDADLDYGLAKLAFDRFIDPSVDPEVVYSQLDKLADAARRFAGPTASPDARLVALRRTIYERGTWNGGQPFAYDPSDPLGQRLSNKLLHNYLATRLVLRRRWL